MQIRHIKKKTFLNFKIIKKKKKNFGGSFKELKTNILPDHLVNSTLFYLVNLINNCLHLKSRGVFIPLSASPTKWSNTLKQFGFCQRIV